MNEYVSPLSSSSSPVGREAAVLAAVEVGLGSVLHALHVPLAGNFLSLNQAAFLAYSLRRNRDSLTSFERRTFPFFVSQATALLKSLSPAGKKLTPMLAISAQGACFAAGTAAAGANLIGVTIGAALLSLWSFAQIALIGWILLGNTGVEILQKLTADTSRVGSVILAVILGKAILAALLAATAWSFPDFWLRRVIHSRRLHIRLPDLAETPEAESPWAGAARDLLRPLPLIAILAPLAFFVFSQASWAQVAWLSLRPLALAYLGFVIIRLEWPRRKLRELLSS